MRSPFLEKRHRLAGVAAIVGGVLGLVIAPIMVIVKYMTGWSVIPKPAWIDVVQPVLAPFLSFASPPGLWVAYGVVYTIALVLMSLGILVLAAQLKGRDGRIQNMGVWVLLFGLCLVIPGDAIHTATWHQNGLTTPTPGTNVVANTAYATHMMGMNFVLFGSLWTGIAALRKRSLTRPLAWCFVAIPPSAVVLSVTLLPTTPSGALWLFSALMIALGHGLASRRGVRLTAA